MDSNDSDSASKIWNDLILKYHEELNLSDLDFSALSSWVLDCYQSGHRIYSDLLRKIGSANPEDFELLNDFVSEVFFDLNHIKDHIQAAENGFLELMRVLDKNNDS
jgi:hypothetical protein